MLNHRLLIIEYIEDQLELLTGPNAEAMYGISIQKISQSPVDPVNADESELPAIFYGYGPSVPNGQTAGSQYVGRTSSFIVNVVVNTMYSGQANTLDVRTVEESVTRRSAKVENAVADRILKMKPITHEGVPISPRMEFNLGPVETEAQGISDREFMVITIEVDWFYQQRR